MTSQADGAGSLEVLFNLEEALAGNAITRPAPLQTHGNRGRNDAVTSLAKTAIRLLAGKTAETADAAPCVSEQYMDAFCGLLIKGKMRETVNLARSLASRGADYGDIAEGLFAGAARRMGDRWNADTASLVDVNIGVSTLIRTHIVLCSNVADPKTLCGRTALFSSLQGQAHTLGLAFAAEFFRQNGWGVRYMPAATPEDVLVTAASESPDIVGLTAAMDAELDMLRDAIQRLRLLPSRPRIILGGSSPHLAALNADAVVSRLDMALLAGHRLLG